MQRISLHLTDDELRRMDLQVTGGFVASRAELIRRAIDRELFRMEAKQKNVGWLTGSKREDLPNQ